MFLFFIWYMSAVFTLCTHASTIILIKLNHLNWVLYTMYIYIVSEKLIELDNTEWYREHFNDRRNGQNGNKLRTYRLYKHDVKSAPYVLQNISRFERRTMALFRSGALPLAYETGRYSRPPVPADDRLCVYCMCVRMKNIFSWSAICMTI